MNKKKTSILLGIILLICGIFLLKNNLFNTPKKLRLAIASEIDTFDPAQAFNDDSLRVLSQVHEPLFQYHYLKRPYEILPLLAENMPKISKDGLEYTIKIKSNVRYHPHQAFQGIRTVKAIDFVNQVKRLAFKPLKSTGRWIFSGRMLGFDEFSNYVGQDYERLFSTKLKGIEAIDDHTLKIRLISADAKMIYFLAMNFVVPVPMEIISYYKGDLSSIMIGTGPYKLQSWSVNDNILLRKFKSYRKDDYPSSGDRYANTNGLLDDRQKQIPFLDEISFQIIVESKKRWNLFMKGKLDAIDIPKNYLSKALSSSEKLKDKDIHIKHFPSLSSRWLGFNMKDKVMTKNIRKAISYAINYDQYIEVLFNNTNLSANSIYAPGIPGYDPSRTLPYEFNLDKARALMKKAGFEGGKGFPSLTYSTRSSTQTSLTEAKLIQSQLSEIGIKVEIKILEFKEFLKKGRAGELQIFTDQWIYDYPDAENLVQLLITKNHPGINKAAYSNILIDSLYNKLIKTTDVDAKKIILYDIENQVNKDLPWIKLTFESTYILHYGYVNNWRSSSVMRNFLKYIKLK
jgi:oligopeptide transport system substrate-binding protein